MQKARGRSIELASFLPVSLFLRTLTLLFFQSLQSESLQQKCKITTFHLRGAQTYPGITVN